MGQLDSTCAAPPRDWPLVFDRGLHHVRHRLHGEAQRVVAAVQAEFESTF
jgi:hypothetical protein